MLRSGGIVACVASLSHFPAVSLGYFVFGFSYEIYWLIFSVSMHHGTFVARGELCNERGCRVVSLSTSRRGLRGFVFCDFVVEPLI